MKKKAEDWSVHIPAKAKGYTDKRSEVIRVSQEAYNTVIDIYNETSLSLSELASLLILESAKRVVYDK